MYFSKYNIFSKLKESDNYFIVNLLTGNADIISAETAGEIKTNTISNEKEFIEKGYLTEIDSEKRLYNNKYLDFIDKRDNDEIQIFFVPWYACNFGCSYCYQSGYDNEHEVLSGELIDSFFSYIKKEFTGRRKYITIFGGEPLLSGTKYKDVIKYILKKAGENNLDTAIVTNGYNLEEYIDILKEKRIREIQVTLDGTEELNNKRRPLKNGGGTFDKIVKGIDEALQNNLTINLRVVLDKENISSLPELAKLAKDKGWTQNANFKTQLGRNYELHYCQEGNSRLFSRVEFYESIYNLIKTYPDIIEFHKPAFSISKFLFENGELPDPLFDACTGCKTEWAFDYTGNIYSCTATVGKPGSSLGTFFPEVTKKEQIIREWEERDVTTIPECKNCSLQLACGGGCTAIAYNQKGKLNSPDCRPVKELLEMGISYYFNTEINK